MLQTSQLQPFKRIIQYVLKLYKSPDAFCQKVEAKDVHGTPVTSLDAKACSWCLSGALYKASVTLYGSQIVIPHYSDLSEWFDEQLANHSLYTFPNQTGAPYSHIILNDEYGYDAVVTFLKEMQKKLKKIEKKQ